MNTKADRDALRVLYEAATPGPWVARPQDVDADEVAWDLYQKIGDNGYQFASVFTQDHGDFFGLNEPNATLIPAAHNALPELLDMAGRAERYEAALREIVGNGDRKTLTLERAAALINKLRGIAREALAQPEEARE